jgi:hypothetical protein
MGIAFAAKSLKTLTSTALRKNGLFLPHHRIDLKLLKPLIPCGFQRFTINKFLQKKICCN